MHLNIKNKQITQWKNWQKIQIDIYPKNTYEEKDKNFWVRNKPDVAAEIFFSKRLERSNT